MLHQIRSKKRPSLVSNALPANCAMKIEFLTNYDSSNPKDCIFRIYDFNSEEVKKLVVIFREVAEGVTPEIDLGHQNFICPIGGVTLELRLGSIDEGIFQISDNDFLCTLSKSGWENAIDLAQPFVESENINGYQWLYDLNSNIEFLLSRNGKW